jgi:hypothetical protein
MPTFKKRPLIVKKSALMFEEEECHRFGPSAAEGDRGFLRDSWQQHLLVLVCVLEQGHALRPCSSSSSTLALGVHSWDSPARAAPSCCVSSLFPPLLPPSRRTHRDKTSTTTTPLFHVSVLVLVKLRAQTRRDACAEAAPLSCRICSLHVVSKPSLTCRRRPAPDAMPCYSACEP